MKKSILALLLLVSTAYAKPVPGINDYGQLMSADKFSIHCTVNDPGISGSSVATVYSNGQISCANIQALYNDMFVQAQDFLSKNNYILSNSAEPKRLTLRILTLAELNSPNNFSKTDSRCMHNASCASGAYFGRTFYDETTVNINVYVVHSSVGGKYSFISTLKHELMHAILYRYHWSSLLGESKEHALIDKFLKATK